MDDMQPIGPTRHYVIVCTTAAGSTSTMVGTLGIRRPGHPASTP
jgi:hypothetical protein